MLKFIGIMVICGLLSLAVGPWVFLVAIAGYLLKWIFGKK